MGGEFDGVGADTTKILPGRRPVPSYSTGGPPQGGGYCVENEGGRRSLVLDGWAAPGGGYCVENEGRDTYGPVP